MSVGKQWERDLLTSLRSMGHWAERFRDNTFAAGRATGSHASPPDMIAVMQRQPTLIELKAISTGFDSQRKPRDLMKGGISLKRCQGHQLQRLKNFRWYGASFIAVLFYTPRAQRRSAVFVPTWLWDEAFERYGSGTLRLDRLREDVPAGLHMKWVGRKSEVGPYLFCTSLGDTPEGDR